MDQTRRLLILEEALPVLAAARLRPEGHNNLRNDGTQTEWECS